MIPNLFFIAGIRHLIGASKQKTLNSKHESIRSSEKKKTNRLADLSCIPWRMKLKYRRMPLQA